MSPLRRIDEKFTAVLIATWSVLLACATIDTFCSPVAAPESGAVHQVAQAAAPTASGPLHLEVATAAR